MNPDLAKLQPDPFEKLRLLFKDITPDPRYSAIDLGIGEPKHPFLERGADGRRTFRQRAVPRI